MGQHRRSDIYSYGLYSHGLYRPMHMAYMGMVHVVVAHPVMACMVTAYIIAAYIVMAGVYGTTSSPRRARMPRRVVVTSGRCSMPHQACMARLGPHSYGRHSDGLLSDGLYSYGLHYVVVMTCRTERVGRGGAT